MNENKEIIGLINALFEDSKHFLIEAKKREDNDAIAERYNKAVILFAWAGFEGWINKSCIDFAGNISGLSIHEKAFLTEKRVELRKGEFTSSNSDKYESTENKIEFLVVTIAKSSFDKSIKHWQEFQEIKKHRDSLVHPKKGRTAKFTTEMSEKTITTLVHFLNLLSKKLYKKGFKI